MRYAHVAIDQAEQHELWIVELEASGAYDLAVWAFDGHDFQRLATQRFAEVIAAQPRLRVSVGSKEQLVQTLVDGSHDMALEWHAEHFVQKLPDRDDCP